MTKSWSLKRFKTSLCGVPSRRDEESNISARTRDMMRNRCDMQYVVASTPFTFPARVKALRFLNAAAVGHVAGSWNEPTRGPTERDAC